MENALANVSKHNELDDTENVGYDLVDNNQVRLALGVVQDYIRHLANDTNNPGITQETAEKIIGKAQGIKDDGLDMLKIGKHYVLESLRQYRLALNGRSMASVMQDLFKLLIMAKAKNVSIYSAMKKPYRNLYVLHRPTVDDVDYAMKSMIKAVTRVK